MPNDDFYSKGTIKIKNADGILEPFLPITDVSCIDDSNGTPLTQTISNITTKIEAAENSGGIELVYYEPTEESVKSISNETIIAWVDEPDTWRYVIDTSVHVNKNGWSEPENTKTAIPFNLYGTPGITLTVDWGDGSTSTLTSSDYTEDDSTASEHTYASKGIYTVKIKSSDWSSTYFSTFYYARLSYTASETKLNCFVYFRGTLVRIESPIPGIKGTRCWMSQNGSRTTYNNSLSHLFKECVNLQHIIPSLFKNCSNVTSFEDCFSGCMELKEIPKNLFNYTPNAVNFNGCFEYNYDVMSIPDDLFTYTTQATDFGECFQWCPILSIPENLFKYTTLATNFSKCFRNCSEIKTIPETLFRYNALATDFSNCFESTGVTEIPEDLFRYNTSAANFSNCFDGINVTSIPENLFRYNTSANDFKWCFSSCSNLTSIPENLFRYNINATDFTLCFAWCHSLTTLPSNLFRYNVAATDFGGCFSRCDSLTAIPLDLFRYNVAATDFGGCFETCTSLNDITTRIGSSSVTDSANFVTLKSGTVRTVYVPSGSATETSFNSVALDLGLTVIGE